MKILKVVYFIAILEWNILSIFLFLYTYETRKNKKRPIVGCKHFNHTLYDLLSIGENNFDWHNDM